MIAAPPSTMTVVDYFILVIFGISILLGYLKGFLKEVISLITIIVASVVSTMFSGKLAAMFSGTASTSSGTASVLNPASGVDVSHAASLLSIGASFIALFLGTMLAGYIVSTIITGVASNAGASLTNRFLGALFGCVRGYILVIIFMFIAELTPMAEQTAWVQSEFVKSFQPMVSWIQKEVSPSLENLRKQMEGAIEGATQQMGNIQGMFNGSAASPDGQ